MKPALQSTTIQGGLIAVLVMIKTIFEVDIPDDQINLRVESIFGIISFLMVIIGRFKAKDQISIGSIKPKKKYDTYDINNAPNAIYENKQ